ncbi:uncharacterized protein CCOS01_08793 [Colletotrichum costaricense]|uniref:Zn(2)-C6 fungal-type domain-containing protein n=1 Tax=Colletotrichum costaricense TaxID=1209916 RepID=A0AAJ0DZT2_9PEZI|nr:uncharacterized protein CCOS01_08793 [Colletotrichum costaricense]KAK1526375.1 hypothetical protein CCOS01_08793 [Colletotrichum costaricense]
MSSASDITQFTSVFRAQSLSDGQRRVTKRNRQPVSCLACRARKLRCDRALPCGACVRRGDEGACKFGAAAPASASTSASAPAPASASTPSTSASVSASASGGANAVTGTGSITVSGSDAIPVTSGGGIGNTPTSTTRADGNLAAVTSDGATRHRRGSGAGQQPRPEVHFRLRKLEDMVQDLVRRGMNSSKDRDRNGPQSTPAPASGPGPTKSTGTVNAVPTPPTDSEPLQSGSSSTGDDSPAPIAIDGDDAYYGATHWTALLHHIREIKTALEPDPTVAPEHPEGGACSIGPDFLFGAVVPVSLPEVLYSLPPRQDLEKLLGVYFNARFTAVPFIHVGRFQREYAAFWANPESMSWLWISILFSIISNATVIVRGKGNAEALGLNPAKLKEASAYSGRAVQCLIKGNYLAARPYSVEATLLVAYSRVLGSRDMDPVLWNMFGVATRLAQRRGYHLEPSHLSVPITPFDAEMRRRAWFYCEAFDLLLSFQLGMPAIVHEGDNDAVGPENHPDEDFDENTTTMPPPRPPTEATPSLYYCYKSKLCRILRRVIRHALSPAQPAYAETQVLNDTLHAWHAALPAVLRVRPIRETGFTEQNHTVMQRLMLELMYSKALCVLHRRYLSREKGCYNGDPRFASSREICRAAALRVLDLHAEFDREASPGGRLFEDRYMLSSLTLHDFMIAAMVVCLDLNESTDTSDEDYERKMEALKTASEIWSRRSDCSKDARHAAAVLRAMVQRISRQRKQQHTDNITSTTATAETAANTGSSSFDGPYRDPALFSESLSLHSGFGDVDGLRCRTPGQGQGFLGEGAYQSDEFDFMALDNALNDPASVDWSMLDQYLMLDRAGELAMDVSLE